MKFRVERDARADAVAWTAKSLPSRPSVPVLSGVLLRVADQRLSVSGFDYEVSSQVTVGVQADADGAALVSGRLLAEITKSLRALPIDDPQVRRPDITRAKQLLGWEPEVDIRDGLRLTIEHYANVLASPASR